jgi:hypothetical protein
MKDLGVKIERGRSLSLDDITLQVLSTTLKHFQNNVDSIFVFFIFFVQGLKDQGYQGVFIGIGLPQAKRIPIFQNLSEQMGFYTSKDFLPKVSVASKPGMYTMHSLFICLSFISNLVGIYKKQQPVRLWSIIHHRNVQVQIGSAVAARERDRPGSGRHGLRLRHVGFALRRQTRFRRLPQRIQQRPCRPRRGVLCLIDNTYTQWRQ